MGRIRVTNSFHGKVKNKIRLIEIELQESILTSHPNKLLLETLIMNSFHANDIKVTIKL